MTSPCGSSSAVATGVPPACAVSASSASISRCSASHLALVSSCILFYAAAFFRSERRRMQNPKTDDATNTCPALRQRAARHPKVPAEGLLRRARAGNSAGNSG